MADNVKSESGTNCIVAGRYFRSLIIKELVPETIFSSGFNVYQTDLSGISLGIYLVYIYTKNGFKTKRLIVST